MPKNGNSLAASSNAAAEQSEAEMLDTWSSQDQTTHCFI